MQKEWLQIPGFSGYEMNADGVVRNATKHNIIKPKTDKPGQVQIKADSGKSLRLDVSAMALQLFYTDAKAAPTKAKVMRSTKLTEQQKIYFLKTVENETHAAIGEQFGYTKDKVSGLYDRIRLNPAKIEEYKTALNAL